MRIMDWNSDVCSSDLNRVPANARLYRHFFSAIYRCGDDRAIRLGQKGFGRETYLCTPRGTSGGIEGNYPYVVGGVFLQGCRWVKIGTGYLLPIHHLASTSGGADIHPVPRSAEIGRAPV